MKMGSSCDRDIDEIVIKTFYSKNALCIYILLLRIQQSEKVKKVLLTSFGLFATTG